MSCGMYSMYNVPIMDLLLSWCFVAVQEPSHRDSDPVLIEEDMTVMSDFELHRLCQQYPALQEHQLTTEQLLDSGKLHFLRSLLTDLKEQVGASSVVISTQRLSFCINYLNPSIHSNVRSVNCTTAQLPVSYSGSPSGPLQPVHHDAGHPGGAAQTSQAQVHPNGRLHTTE